MPWVYCATTRALLYILRERRVKCRRNNHEQKKRDLECATDFPAGSRVRGDIIIYHRMTAHLEAISIDITNAVNYFHRFLSCCL